MAEAHFYGEGITRSSTPAWEELLDALEAHRPAWHADALCKEDHPGVTWFPSAGQSSEPAKDVCRRCLVEPECRAAAMADGDIQGVWGGTSGRDRRQMRAEAPPALAPRVCWWCGTAFYRAASPGGAKACCGAEECRRARSRESVARWRANAG